MLICLLLATLIYLLVVREPPPRWRATYFGNERLEGQALVREERDVNYDWQRGGPVEGIPNDQFSARWDSCLTLERAQSVAFQLTSDDGSRLFIDGRLAIDIWGRHMRSLTRGTDVPLQAGMHHLRVEYYERVSVASVTLAASFDNGRPRRIAPERLRFPDGDQEHPCEATPAP
jgi:beta-glucosidase